RIACKHACGPLPDLAQEGAFGMECLGTFPLRLARQPRADEAAIGLGLVGAEPVDRKGRKAAFPVLRPLDPALAAPGPALRRPEGRLAVAARLDEAAILPLAHRPACQAKAGELDTVGRALVVESVGPVIALARASRRDLDQHFLLGRSRALGWGGIEAGQSAHDGDGLGVLRL